MNIVKFPGLNLEFKFSQIAFSLFGIDVYKYAVCIVLGIIIALILCRLSKEKFDVDYSFVLENCIIAIIFGTIGARLYYILFNLDYYYENPLEILNFRNGGLAIYGGLIFAGIAILIHCTIRKKDVLNLFDYVVPFVALGQCIGRFGNFFNIEAYGYECNSILRMGINTISGYIEVHPVFLYESIANFIIFIVLRIFQKNRKFKGGIFLLYCTFYSIVRTITEGLRVDSLMLLNFRVSQLLSIIIFVISIGFIIANLKKIKKSKI